MRRSARSMAADMTTTAAQTTSTGARSRSGRRVPAIGLLRAGLLLLFLALWEGGARLGWIDAFFYGTPGGISGNLAQQFASGSVWKDFLATGHESLLGLGLGLLAGGPFGWIAAERRPPGQLIEAVMALLKAIPDWKS